jgi:hypothetical protein
VRGERFSGKRGNPEGGLRLEEFTRHRATSAACRFGPFAKPYRNDRYLRIPAGWYRRQADIADRDGWRVSISQFKENGAVKVRDAIAFRETPP